MGGQTSNLILVVDPNYGDRVETAAHTAPVWVVASVDNKGACKRLWSAQPTGDHRERDAVTCYEVGDTEDRFNNLLNIIPTLEEHHGEIRDAQFSFPQGFILEVIGLKPTTAVTNALREFGFSSFSETANGFHAYK